MWLIIGGITLLLAILAWPVMSAMMQQAAAQQQVKMPPEAIVAIQIITLAFLGCIYVLLPALFLLFYQRESVRETCRWRNPQTCWTDRCPMPVLALCILYAASALGMLSSAASGWVVPVFGTVLSGAAGAAVILPVTLLIAYLAWGSYRLQMAAWWAMLLFGIAGILNMLTVSPALLMEMYGKMRMPAGQLEMMQKSGMIELMSRWMPWMGLASGVAWLGYFCYVRRYFVRGREAVR
jgi:hypothetical protein